MMIVDTAAIRAAMLEQGVGTVELATRAGLPHKTVSFYATGKQTRARVPTITKLARALNVKPTELVKRDGDGNIL